MKIPTLFFLLFCSLLSFSQSQKAPKDTLIWTDGTKYAGQVIKENKKTGEVQFMTEDSQMHNVSSSAIAKLIYVHPPVEAKPTTVNDDKSLPKSEYRQSVKSDEAIDWSDPGIPRKVILKHNTGIGLTITGTTLMVGGIALIAIGASNNGQTTKTTNAYGGTQTNVNIGPEGGVGLLCVIAGLPMMISGAVKIGRSNRMARARMIHLNK